MRNTRHYEMDMCSGPLLPKILRFTLPLILTGVLQLLYNAADVVVVGQFVGPQALAAARGWDRPALMTKRFCTPMGATYASPSDRP